MIFEHGGTWLHPLFALEAYLDLHPELPRGMLVIRDRIIGRAAAFLALRLGIHKVHAEILSARAVSLYACRGQSLIGDKLVERIDCMTEDLLADISDPDEAWAILCERRRLALGLSGFSSALAEDSR